MEGNFINFFQISTSVMETLAGATQYASTLSAATTVAVKKVTSAIPSSVANRSRWVLAPIHQPAPAVTRYLVHSTIAACLANA